MRVLVACEESQRVCIAFRERGHEAYSCDIQDCSGGHPEWHIKGDVLDYMGKNKYNDFKGWDIMIGFPDCTYTSYVGNRWLRPEYNIQIDLLEGHVTRQEKRKRGFDFFMKLIDAPIPHIAVENPVGIIQKWYRKSDQIIHPYYFGEPFKKRTCLWLKSLPKLIPSDMLPEPEPIYYTSTRNKPVQWCESLGFSKERAKTRSRTFKGIAEAMAKQWGDYITIQSLAQKKAGKTF